ncbi:MAG: biopolymer transporter ExbD [Candidatus Tectomicrobia bacterium]|nr:biopolymer transporter ExbD [Candidatus Tectomicrobia bacterium]
MRFKRQDDDRGGQFELISMTDIVFLLLIFFMISTTFVDLDNQLDIQLPEAPGKALEEGRRSYVIEMGMQDGLLLDGSPVQLNDLPAELARIARPGRQDSVLIRADKRLPYGDVMEVLGLVQETQIGDIAVAVR